MLISLCHYNRQGLLRSSPADTKPDSAYRKLRNISVFISTIMYKNIRYTYWNKHPGDESKDGEDVIVRS